MIFHDSGLAGKTALVTGGSRGIGREIVRQLAAEGAAVTFFYRADRAAAEATRAECALAGHEVAAVQVDVRDAAACTRAVDELLEQRERIDILVNNSGVIRDNLLAMFTDEEITDVLATNVHGTFFVTRAVIPAMIRQRQGTIVNVSSVAGVKGGRGQTNYAASKGAIDALTRALAVELAPRRIRVNAVAPGVVETEMSREVRERAGDQVLERILLRRYGTAAEIAHVVCFLASRYAEYITGQVIHVDGGFKMA
jgi:3-oxoacyl-[acyl-carrier protein] reductase